MPGSHRGTRPALRRPTLLGMESELALSMIGRDGTPLPAERSAARAVAAAGAVHAHLRGRDDFDLFLGNGARLYRDNGLGLCNLEYATPECTSPDELVAHARAGDAIVAQAVADVVAVGGDVAGAVISKTNLDYGGTTNGSHENHLHACGADHLAPYLIPLLASRVSVCGGGGFDDASPGIDFLCSPRVTHLEQVISWGAQSRRAIFTFKDEDLAGGRYRRLQLLCSEGVRCELSERLRFGMVSLIVRLLEAGARPGLAMRLAHPLGAIEAFARDPDGRVRVPLAAGGDVSALEIQRHYLEAVEARLGEACMPAWGEDLCRDWRSTLQLLAADAERLVGYLDWVTKRHLYREHCRRRGFEWSTLGRWGRALRRLRACRQSPPAAGTGRRPARTPDLRPLLERRGAARSRLADALTAHDLPFADLERFAALRDELFELDVRFGELGRGSLFETLERDGVIARSRVGDDAVQHAASMPPEGQRAARRGALIRRLHADRAPFRCHWDRIWNPCTDVALDLGDPFRGPPPARRRREPRTGADRRRTNAGSAPVQAEPSREVSP